jgi:hypothetical protein
LVGLREERAVREELEASVESVELEAEVLAVKALEIWAPQMVLEEQAVLVEP